MRNDSSFVLIGFIIAFISAIDSRTLPLLQTKAFCPSVSASSANDAHQSCACSLENGSTVVCCGVQHLKELNCTQKNFESATSLIIESPKVTTFSITYGLIRSLNLKLDTLEEVRVVNSSTLETLNICQPTEDITGIVNDDQLIACNDLSALKRLDVSNNQLTSLSEFQLPLKELYLSGNRWACFRSNIQHNDQRIKRQTFKEQDDWLVSPMAGWLAERYGQIVKDSSKTLCARPKQNIFYKSSNSSYVNVTLLHLLEFNRTMFESCPDKCHCSLNNYNTPLWVTVNCSSQNLTKLPERLPENTLELDVSHNQIKSLEPLRRSESAYLKLKKLHADHNELLSMSDLIGSHFMKNKPTILNLQFNNLTIFDLDVLRPRMKEVEESPPVAVKFLFAGNQWSCDCETVSEIHDFLVLHNKYLHDAELMACQNGMYMLKLQYNDLCSSSVDHMTILIVFEVILLVLIIAKLGYDVKHYNQTGELPWIARHICLGFSYSGLKSANQNSGSDWQPNDNYADNTRILPSVKKPLPAVAANNVGNDQSGSKVEILFSKCLGKKESMRSTTSSKDAFGLQEQFRPRRHTASASRCSSSRVGGLGPATTALVSKSPMMQSNHQKGMETADLIERCASGSPRSMASQPSSSSSHHSNDGENLGLVQGQAKSEVPPRVKKISLEEAEQYRKDVLDPEFPEERQHVVVHDDAQVTPPVRKISRMNGYVASTAC